MEQLELIRTRRSVRKYLPQKVEREKLDQIVEAGLYAPSPGGRQATRIILIDNQALIDQIGIVNASCERRIRPGVSISTEQPSIIDDQSIRSGFYGCPALAILCIPRENKALANEIGGAYISAQNMCLAAHDLGVGSVIVGRGEATFQQPDMAPLLAKWGVDPDYMPLVFVCLGYIDGSYPHPKPRKDNRVIFVD